MFYEFDELIISLYRRLHKYKRYIQMSGHKEKILLSGDGTTKEKIWKLIVHFQDQLEYKERTNSGLVRFLINREYANIEDTANMQESNIHG